ncbi:hypothetical protein REPUB_Repub01dG0009000 [Reevesia pubescens]
MRRALDIYWRSMRRMRTSSRTDGERGQRGRKKMALHGGSRLGGAVVLVVGYPKGLHAGF